MLPPRGRNWQLINSNIREKSWYEYNVNCFLPICLSVFLCISFSLPLFLPLLQGTEKNKVSPNTIVRLIARKVHKLRGIFYSKACTIKPFTLVIIFTLA